MSNGTYDYDKDPGNWDDQHDDAEPTGTPVNLNHGSQCNSCNNAVLNDMESNHRRSATFGQAINNLRSYKTDKHINALGAHMRRRPGYNPPAGEK